MSSIITNGAAVTALRLLRNTDAGLGTTQNQVSSGLKVAAASDNAAYWSISTTMTSDNSALSAVSDALGLGAAKVDTAYTGMSAVADLLTQFKARLVTATDTSVDRTKVQAELDQLKAQVQSVASSASFDGQNWLSTDIADITDATQNQASVVSSFVRDGEGSVSVKKVDVDLSEIALFNEAGGGLLQTAPEVVPVVATLPGNLGGLKDASGNPPVVQFSPVTLGDNDSISFDYTANGTIYPITITKADIDARIGRTDGSLSNVTDMAMLLFSKIFAAAGAAGLSSISWSPTGGNIHIYPGGAGSGTITNVTSSSGNTASGGSSGTGGSGTLETRPAVNFMDIDITDGGDIGDDLTAIETMQQSVISAASTLGSLKSRIDLQTDFTAKLSDSLTSGIGKLVDADMEEASTRLQALQTQQQLTIQSLGIANSSSQSLLSLFRN